MYWRGEGGGGREECNVKALLTFSILDTRLHHTHTHSHTHTHYTHSHHTPHLPVLVTVFPKNGGKELPGGSGSAVLHQTAARERATLSHLRLQMLPPAQLENRILDVIAAGHQSFLACTLVFRELHLSRMHCLSNLCSSKPPTPCNSRVYYIY